MAEIWRIAPGQQLASRGWDDEFVLYNNLSGDTHLVDGDSMALLVQLQQGPASFESLLAHFADGLAPADLADLHETIMALLAQLKKLYVVDTMPAPC